MATTKPPSPHFSPPSALRFAALLALPFMAPATLAAPGFATRDLNPILQPLYLPSYIPLRDDDGWQLNHSLFITNTSQQDTKRDEVLNLDVENYRYELALGLRHEDWILHLTLPLLANRGGQLDALIEDWHDFFGFSNGDRDRFSTDQIQIEYLRDGKVEYAQTESSSGVGDLAIAFGYQAFDQVAYFVGVELPTGSESELSGNEALDIAAWLSAQRPLGQNSSLYGLFGFSLPGDDGALEGLTVDVIWLAQLGFEYRFDHGIVGTAQFDFHSKTVDDSRLEPFNESLQLQLGLGFTQLFETYRLDLFFSEDVLIGSAPDITLGLRLGRYF